MKDILLKTCVDYLYTLSVDDEGTMEYVCDMLQSTPEQVLELFKELNIEHCFNLHKKIGNEWTFEPLI